MRRFYDAVNARDLERATALLEPDCLYEDMIYAQPFVGADAVAAHLKAVFKALPDDLAFVVRADARQMRSMQTLLRVG